MCLNENQVVDAVCEFLESNGAAVEQRCTTKQKGTDIVARRPGSAHKLLIEAKGGTSTDPSSQDMGRTTFQRRSTTWSRKPSMAESAYAPTPNTKGMRSL